MLRRGFSSRRRVAPRVRVVEQLEGRRLLNAADLDASFSEDGLYLASDALVDAAAAVRRQDDGKFVVAGAAVTSTASGDYGFYVQRFNADGSPDGGFGTGGRVLTQFAPGGDFANDVLIQPDGRIVAVGATNGIPQSGNSAFALVRYLPDGTPDAGFGSDGLVITDVGTRQDSILGATLQPDGKIVVAGYSATASGVQRFTVARYLADGALDGSFGDGGVVLAALNEFASSAAAVTIDADGKIVVAGTSNITSFSTSENYVVARFNEDGSLDGTFDGDGRAVIDFHGGSDRAAAIAIQDDGKILVAGDAIHQFQAHMAAARLNPDGSPDTTWADDGSLMLSNVLGYRSRAVAVLVHSDGRVVLAGQRWLTAGGPSDFALVRLTETADLDPTFSIDGIHTVDFASTIDQAGDAILLPGERILMVGSANGGATARPFDTAMAQFEGGVEFAALQLGTLSVVGTAGDDAIEITRSGQDYVITRNGMTNVITAEGQPAGVVTLNVVTLGGNDSVNVGVVRPGSIGLGAGDDAVTLASGGVGTQPLNIDGAAGADTLDVPANVVVPVTFNGGAGTGANVVNFTGSDGDDAIEVSNASVTGAGTNVAFSSAHSVNVQTRGGNDAVTWANDRPASVDLGDGDDTINFTRGSFFSVVTVSGGTGDDVVVAVTGAGTGANVQFDPGEGTDKVILQGRDLIDTVGFGPTEVAGIPIVRFAGLELLVVNGNGDDDDISGRLAPDGPQVEINGNAGDDKITVHFAPGARATVHGGDGADALNLAGTAGDDTIAPGEAAVDVNGEGVPFTGIERVSLNGSGGSDTIVYSGSLNLPALDVEGGGGGTDVLRLVGGDGPDAFTLVNDNRVTHGARIIGMSGINEIVLDDSAGSDALDARGSLPVRLPGDEELASLTIGPTGHVVMSGERSTVRTAALTIESGGSLDVGTGSLHVAGGNIEAIEALMKTAREGSTRWAGPGIGTRWAGAVTGLCAAEVAAPTPGVLVKYTYDGDANLDGRINADDYFRIDSAFLAGEPKPLCSMGDFNFDDTINADDYFLIDSAFLGQGAGLGERSGAARVVAMEERADRKVGRRIRGRAVWERREGRRAARHFGEIPRDGGDD